MLFFDHRARDGAAPYNQNHPGRYADNSRDYRSTYWGRFTSCSILGGGARSDIQAEYDLAALGEVEDIHGPFCNPPKQNAASEIQQTRLVARMSEVGLP